VFNTLDVLKVFSEQALAWNGKNVLISRKQGETCRLMKFLKDLVSDGMTVLDVGTGTGKIAHRLTALGKDIQIFAVDIVFDMLRKFGQEDKETTALCLTDIQRTCFRANLFDIITAQQVLHHLPNPAHVLDEAYRILKPKGYIIILTVGTEYQSEIFPYSDCPITEDALGRTNPEQIKALLEGCGFLNCKIKNDFFQMRFDDFRSYFDFMKSIGSLNKLYNYKVLPSSAEDNLYKQAASVGATAKNGHIDITGHYITALAKKEG